MTNIIQTVIDNDYCIGCGVCASFEESPFEIRMDENGKYKAFLKYNLSNDFYENSMAEEVCPFYNNYNENEIASDVFDKEIANYNEYTGYYLANYVGYVKEGSFREKGSSGGMANWIATKLLEKNLVDGIIHVRDGEKGNLFYEYQISYNSEDLFRGAKSKYYPIELSNVLNLVRKNKGKYALIGIPCFIKAVRLLAKQDSTISNSIKFYIGLVCGHLKSDMFAKSIGWQLGIEPDDLENVDFRKKLPDQPANRYGVEVFGKKEGSRTNIVSPTKELFTTNWGQGFFKYNACEFCDDVLAETADITLGDAWLPDYQDDYLGTNVITIRNAEILKIVQENIELGNIHLEEVPAETIYESQAGGFRHRRDGLSYRLHLKDKESKWRPEKRVVASNRLSKKRKVIYEKRMELSSKSFEAYKLAYDKGEFNVLVQEMEPSLTEYRNVIKTSFVRRLLGKLKREVMKLR